MAASLLLLNITVYAQVKSKNKKNTESKQLSNFKKYASEAGIDFELPEGFKEVKAINNADLSFDYAMTIPGQEFEVWLEVKSLKSAWKSYERSLGTKGAQLGQPDSLYKELSHAYAVQLTSDAKPFTRNLPPKVLEQYNADAGKTYLLNLNDSPDTKNYKYALLIALQKSHIGTLIAICLTNEKGPGFFKNINQARDCIKFR